MNDRVPGSQVGWEELFPELGAADLVDLLAWADRLHESEPTTPTTATAGPPPVIDGSDAVDDGAFAPLVAALAAPAVEEARRRIGQAGCPIDDTVMGQVVAATRAAVAGEVVRTWVSQVHHDSRAGALVADTPEGRYREWLARAATAEGWQRLHDLAPATIRRTGELARARALACADALVLTHRHRRAIGRSLGVDLDATADIVAAGDTHGGRAVSVLRARSGDRVVLKPRDARLEHSYARFAHWLGRRAIGVTLPVPRFHHADDVGWMEHLSPGPHRHPDYFTMLGVHLAALYLARGSDVHHENLLADAEGRPVVVDAEAVMTPRLGPSSDLDVTGTGLLSIPLGDGFDAGALGYRRGARSPFRAWELLRPGRDDCALALREVHVDDPSPVPGDTPRPGDATDLMVACERVLAWAVDHRGEVAARVRRTFVSGSRARLVHRPTMSYALLLRMATHPRFTTPSDRWRIMSRLAVLAPQTPGPLLAAEVRQLVEGDLPAFTVAITGTRVIDARGRDTGVHAAVAPLRDVLDRVRGIEVATVDHQLDLVAAGTAHWSDIAPIDESPSRG